MDLLEREEQRLKLERDILDRVQVALSMDETELNEPGKLYHKMLRRALEKVIDERIRMILGKK